MGWPLKERQLLLPLPLHLLRTPQLPIRVTMEATDATKTKAASATLALGIHTHVIATLHTTALLAVQLLSAGTPAKRPTRLPDTLLRSPPPRLATTSVCTLATVAVVADRAVALAGTSGAPNLRSVAVIIKVVAIRTDSVSACTAAVSKFVVWT